LVRKTAVGVGFRSFWNPLVVEALDEGAGSGWRGATTPVTEVADADVLSVVTTPCVAIAGLDKVSEDSKTIGPVAMAGLVSVREDSKTTEPVAIAGKVEDELLELELEPALELEDDEADEEVALAEDDALLDVAFTADDALVREEDDAVDDEDEDEEPLTRLLGHELAPDENVPFSVKYSQSRDCS